MSRCKEHYPVRAPKWEVVFEDHDYRLSRCTECGEEFGVKLGYGPSIDITSPTYEKRLEASRALVQPFRNGIPSAEYVKLTGGKNMSKEDIKRSKRVWGDTPGLKDVCIK